MTDISLDLFMPVEPGSGRDLVRVWTDRESLFNSLYDAVDFLSLRRKGVITITRDIVLERELVIPSCTEITLNLAGFTLTRTSSAPSRVIENYGSLTICGNGTLGDFEGNVAGAVTNYGNLVLENGNYYGNPRLMGACISCRSGSLLINGGRFICGAVLAVTGDSRVTINDGDFGRMEDHDDPRFRIPTNVIPFTFFNKGPGEEDIIINGGTFCGRRIGLFLAGNGVHLIFNGGRFALNPPAITEVGTEMYAHLFSLNGGSVSLLGGEFGFSFRGRSPKHVVALLSTHSRSDQFRVSKNARLFENSHGIPFKEMIRYQN